MDGMAPRDWKDGEGWSEQDLVWTDRDTRLVRAAMRGQTFRVSSYEEIRRRVESLRTS